MNFLCQVFIADGEKTEPLGARFAREQGTIPNLKICLRCRVHAVVKSLENSLASCPKVDELIKKWVLGFSTGKGEPGGFARALRNSPRLLQKYKDHHDVWITQLDETIAKMRKFHFEFAPQRHNTVTELAGLVISNLVPIFRLLVELRVSDDADGKWAQRLLNEVFTSRNLLLLAMVAELSSVAVRFTRRFDGTQDMSGRASHVARTASWLGVMRDELQRLFRFRSSDGTLQEPLIFSSAFDKGYVQILQRDWNMLVSESILSNNKLIFYKTGASGRAELRKWLAEELGSIWNVADVFVSAVEAECDIPAAQSLQPFDLEHWKSMSDDALPGTWQSCPKAVQGFQITYIFGPEVPCFPAFGHDPGFEGALFKFLLHHGHALASHRGQSN